ncbi:MAG: anti-sigma factor antagonist [Clostridia bacterium]|nr:anti-sigma factor antagonist [Clostridia bacterium]
MSVAIEMSGDTMTAMLEGEIDHHTARPMRELIDSSAERIRPRLLILDFGGVGFMDSSGIGLIMGRYKLMKELGGAVSVDSMSPSIERMIKLAGLGRLGIGGLGDTSRDARKGGSRNAKK